MAFLNLCIAFVWRHLYLSSALFQAELEVSLFNRELCSNSQCQVEVVLKLKVGCACEGLCPADILTKAVRISRQESSQTDAASQRQLLSGLFFF